MLESVGAEANTNADALIWGHRLRTPRSGAWNSYQRESAVRRPGILAVGRKLGLRVTTSRVTSRSPIGS